MIRTEALKGEGIAELLERIDAHREHIDESGTLAERRARNLRAEVLGIAAARLRRRPRGPSCQRPRVAAAAGAVVRRETDPATAARKLLERAEIG